MTRLLVTRINERQGSTESPPTSWLCHHVLRWKVLISIVLSVSFVSLVEVPRCFLQGGLFPTAKLKANGKSMSTVTYSQEHSNHYQGLCSKFLSDPLGQPKSLQQVWNESIPEILQATYTNNAKIDDWIDKLMGWHTYGRLRRSIAMPLDNHQQFRTILNIVEQEQRPIRIIVLGDSVTAGHQCNINHLGVNIGPTSVWDADKECAWSNRLQKMLKAFGLDAKVINMASGGIDSSIGATALEYRLFPEGMEMPDIVLSAFGSNDQGREEQAFDAGQQLIDAARKLRCNDDLPLIMLVADLVANSNQKQGLAQTAKMYNLAEWNRIGMVNYPASIRHAAMYYNYDNGRRPEHPLLGSRWSVHPGMGYHIGLAWAVLFNLVAAMVDTCHTPADEDQAREKNNEALGLTQIPPSHSIPHLRNGFGPVHYDREWNQNVVNEKARCNGLSSDRVCSYAWMVNHAAGIIFPQDVDRVLKPVLTHVDGWRAEGDPWNNPRTGWYANSPTATFSLLLKNVAVATRYLTIISMKSYGPKFVGSKIRVTVNVQKNTDPQNQEELAIIYNSGTQHSFEISGYHETESSVHITSKLPLPNNGGAIGDNIDVRVEMIGGSHFKIAGMAFCQQ